MGDRLAHREKALLQVELAAEEDRDEIRGERGESDARMASSSSPSRVW